MGDTKAFGPRDSAPPPSAPPDPNAPEPGTLIGGRYLLEAKVAQGGMGAIYAARDERLGRKVAVKVMLEAAVRTPGFTQRFEREARTASRLSHPNCVVVHDFGTDERGAFLVLEWVEGQSLAGLVKAEGPLPPARAADLLAQVCDGLTAAHQAGIIHRDVKPENVMVTRTADGREVAKLVDFGIARVVDSSGEPELTQAGFSLGSPYFMSPEQALAESLDARSDVYSAGATLFFALAGRRPYLGDRLMVVQQLLRADPPDLPPPVSGHPLEQVLRKAMAKSRDARQPSSAELAREIREVSGSVSGALTAPVSAGPAAVAPAAVPTPAVPRTVSTPRWIRRAGGAAVLAAVLAGGTWLLIDKLGPARSAHPDIQRLLEAGELEAAAALIDQRLEEASAEAATDADLQLLTGHLRSARGDEPGAREAYRAALAIRPELAEDATLQRNALEWLRHPFAEPAMELWQEAIGTRGLPALRAASSDPERPLRKSALQLREALGDPEKPDLVAAALLDLKPATDCPVLRGAAERLAAAGDPRGLEPLREARQRLNIIDAICAGPVIDDAIRTLEGGASKP